MNKENKTKTKKYKNQSRSNHQERKTTLVGLTGSIAAGKSTICDILKQINIPYFSADEEVHKLYQKDGEAVLVLKPYFPKAIKQGAVDRRILSHILLEYPKKLDLLEHLIHPLVQKKREQFIKESIKKDERLVVLDIPLLFETIENPKDIFDVVMVVSSSPANKKARLDKKIHLAKETINLLTLLTNRQMPQNEKEKHADIVLYNNGTKDDLILKIKNVFSRLKNDNK